MASIRFNRDEASALADAVIFVKDRWPAGDAAQLEALRVKLRDFLIANPEPPISMKVLRTHARSMGCTVSRRDEEYRVNRIGDPESFAYYTTDSDDALRTMQAIYARYSPKGALK